MTISFKWEYNQKAVSKHICEMIYAHKVTFK